MRTVMWQLMPLVLFLASCDPESRLAALHRRGHELLKKRQQKHGLPAPDFACDAVAAAVVVSDFDYVEHQAQLETEEHRALAQWLLIKHYVPLEEAMFAGIQRVYTFGRPFKLPAVSVDSNRSRNNRGAFRACLEDDMLEEAFADHGLLDGACCEFRSAWASWQEAGVRSNFDRLDNVFRHRAEAPQRDVPKRSCILCMRLHPDLLQAIVHGCWATLAHRGLSSSKLMGSAFNQYLGSPTSKTAHLSAEQRSFQPSFSAVSFKPEMFAAAASIIRGQNVHDDELEVLGATTERNVLVWLDAMAEHCSASSKSVARIKNHRGELRVTAYAVERLIVAVRVANCLRSDDKVREVLNLAGAYMGLPQEWQGDSIKVPSASTVRRFRFVLEASYTYLIRARLREWIDTGVEFIVVLLYDSSPRAGREWMLGEMYVLRLDGLQEFEDAMLELAAMRKRSAVNLESWDEARAAWLNDVMHRIVWHVILTPACLGARATKLPNKFKAAIHTLRLMADSWDMLKHILKSLVCMTSDLGVESDLPRVEFDCAKLFPHWAHDVQDESPFGDVHLRGDSAFIGFTFGLAAPGTEHICHNMQQQVVQQMKHFKPWHALATHLGRFLRGRFYVDRLIEKCVPGRRMQIGFAKNFTASMSSLTRRDSAPWCPTFLLFDH